MTVPACQSPLSWAQLLAYWLREMTPEAEADAETHYLSCACCSGRLEWLAALAAGCRALTRASGLSLVVDGAFVERLRAEGVRVREYRVPRQGAVDCTVTPTDEFVIARLEAPLAGVKQVDLVELDAQGQYGTRQVDIPFVAGADAVVLSTPIDWLRALPETRLRMRLLAIDEDRERVLGDYTFNHSPSRS